MGEVIHFRPRQSPPIKPAVPARNYDNGPLTDAELVRVEELLTEARAGQRRHELPSVFSNAGPADEPLLPCPLTDVSWLDIDEEST